MRGLAIEVGMYLIAWMHLGVVRRLCRTERGCLGLVAPESKVGDLVVVLLGGDAPFLLRESENMRDGKKEYTLVAECYIHGLMNEEGMKMGKIQDLTLR